ncbi:uridine phosphorylase [Devosia sp. 1635]|uniref:phosphorylase family protein n=1 Tax=Devosia sp. 1635 TaxID=2726066 RepID=UPI0024A76BDB|nr:uridine phosphorylase [Devosia sp. 1635]
MALIDRSATWPWKGDTPVHLPRPDVVPQDFLLPGDPGRVDMGESVLTDFAVVGQNREFRMGVGFFEGHRIGICSTGIGGASTEIAMVELAAMGAKRIVRIGGMGALARDLSLGDFLIVRQTPPNSACARPYAPADRAVTAAPEIVAMLDSRRRSLGLAGRIGSVITADGYYRAQGRPDHGDGRGNPDLLDGLAGQGADGIEMEAEIVFAVGAALGVAAGAVLAVHAHRRSDGWLEDYEQTQRDLITIAAGALAANPTSYSLERTPL